MSRSVHVRLKFVETLNTMSKNHHLALLLFGLLFSINFLHAQSILWTGGGDNVSWSDVDNWAPNNLPVSADSVEIGLGAIVTANINADVNNIALINGSTLNIDAGITFEVSGADTGLVVSPLCSLVVAGQLDVKNCVHAGIVNRGYFSNFANVEVVNIDETGIINEGCISNKMNGKIIIDSTNLGLSVDTGMIENIGSLKVNHSEGIAIVNKGVFSNEGGISIMTAGRFGIFNQDSIYNSPSANIEIEDINWVSFPPSGIINYVTSKIMNDGSIIIIDSDDSALTNHGRFYNSNSLDISNCHEGIQNNNYIENYAASSIKINNISHGFTNEEANDTLVNLGSILITNSTTQGIVNRGTISNYDSIKIQTAGNFGISNRDFIYNSSNGVILIDDVTGNGLSSGFFQGNMVNHGQVIISRIMGNPLNVELGAIFECQGVLDLQH